MKNKSVKVNTILNMIRMLLTVIIPLITFPYTSRIFLTEGNGQLNFSISVVQVFTLVASLGIYSYGVREGAKVRENRALFSKLVYELVLINTISTVVSYIVFFICIYFVPSFENYRVLLLINGVAIGFTALGIDWIYGVYEEYRYITMRQIFVQIFIILSMFIFIHDKDDLYLWAALSTVSGVGANVFNITYARKYFDFRSRVTIKYEIKRHIRPIFMLFATQLASKVYSNLDTVLLGILATDHNVGLYSAAVKVNTILITCFTAMYPVFVPRIVQFLRDRHYDEYYVFLNKIFRLVICLALPAVCGIIMLSKTIILLLAGKAFEDAAITMCILAPIVLVSSLSNILYYNVFVPAGKEAKVFICTLIATIVNLVVSVILIPKFAQNGVAIGSLVAEIVALICALIICRKYNTKVLKCLPNVTNYVLGAILIIISCLVLDNFIVSIVWKLLLSVIFGVFFYVISLFLLKDPIINEGMDIVRKISFRFKRKTK